MLDVRVWEVADGLAVRIRTPAGQNHIIDAGRTPEFSPAEHIKRNHWHETDLLDLLVISHQDADHVEDLPNVIGLLGRPRVLLRNKSVPPKEKYGSLTREYQKTLKDLDERYTAPTSPETSPLNPANNGGIKINSWMNDWAQCNDNINNASIVILDVYQGVAFIFPGDIEPDGWKNLAEKNAGALKEAREADLRFLLAPHHGRPSGYSEEMLEFINPSLIIISDGHGAGETDARFRTAASGVRLDGVRNEVRHDKKQRQEEDNCLF